MSGLGGGGAAVSPRGKGVSVVRASLAGRMWAGLGQANAPPSSGRATGILERFRVGDERPENPGRDPRGSPSGTVVEGYQLSPTAVSCTIFHGATLRED